MPGIFRAALGGTDRPSAGPGEVIELMVLYLGDQHHRAQHERQQHVPLRRGE
ncbi:MAG: hypothetical protein HY271_15665 [Deltaproteobacteria bacterium]|nr:hypothetical protein [Deltaproteobacteria bacterium]